MVRKFMSDAEDAVLDLRERREDLLDSGTRVQEDAAGLLTCPRPLSDGLVPLRSCGSQRGARSSLLSDREGTLSTGRGCRSVRRGSSGSAGGRLSSGWCFLRWWWWCRCGGLDDLQRSLTHRATSPFGSGGSRTWWCGGAGLLLLPRATGLSSASWGPKRNGWHSGLRELASLSAEQDSSDLGR